MNDHSNIEGWEDWEPLLTLPAARVRRRGRHIVVDLLQPHDAITTSVRNGGFATHLRHLVNHQSLRRRGARHALFPDQRTGTGGVSRLRLQRGQSAARDDGDDEHGGEHELRGRERQAGWGCYRRRDCHRGCADERDLRRRSRALARDARRPRQGAGGGGHDQHDLARQRPASRRPRSRVSS